jgi:hypothetical protein
MLKMQFLIQFLFSFSSGSHCPEGYSGLKSSGIIPHIFPNLLKWTFQIFLFFGFPLHPI